MLEYPVDLFLLAITHVSILSLITFIFISTLIIVKCVEFARKQIFKQIQNAIKLFSKERSDKLQ
jgi:archaellum component FlaF (FlaF/FlaG flagellin family)